MLSLVNFTGTAGELLVSHRLIRQAIGVSCKHVGISHSQVTAAPALSACRQPGTVHTPEMVTRRLYTFQSCPCSSSATKHRYIGERLGGTHLPNLFSGFRWWLKAARLTTRPETF